MPVEIRYSPIRLDSGGKFEEVPLHDVTFETLSNCPVCETCKSLEDIVILKDSLISSFCHTCGHIFHKRRPAPPWISEWYLKNWDDDNQGLLREGITKSGFVWNGVKARFVSDSIFNFVKGVLSKKREENVLEIGCGYGAQLMPFRLSGFSVSAIEASKRRAKFSSRLGLNVKNIGIEMLSEKTFGKKFDLIFSHHVLEHVSDPNLFIKKVAENLRPGGWLALFVPNSENTAMLPAFFTVVHLHNFSPSSLQYLLKKHGFAIHRFQRDNQLSILARLEPDSKSEGPAAFLEEKAMALSRETFLENVLGPRYLQRKGETYYCSWETPSPRIRTIASSSFDRISNPKAWREVKLRWTGDGSLPIYIEKEGKNSSAPFWIK